MENIYKNAKFKRTKEGYRKYCIHIKKWAEFFGGEEYFKLIIVDDYEHFVEERCEKVYNYLEKNQEKLLDILEECALKEYNYNREVRIKECRQCYLEEVMQLYPKLETRKDAVKFFRLLKIQSIPFGKEEDQYIVFDIKIVILEEREYKNLFFSILLNKNNHVVSMDTIYKLGYLEEIIKKDQKGEKLKGITSMNMAYDRHFNHEEYGWNIIDFSELKFRGRSIMGKYKELLPYLSSLGLLETDESNSDCGIPPGSKIIGCLGVDGIYFFIAKRIGIKKEEAPIYVLSPMNFECFVAPVARNLLEFISLGVACRNFGMLEMISVSDKVDIEKHLKEEDQDPNVKELISLIKQKLPIIPIEDPYNYVRKIQGEEVFIKEAEYLKRYIYKKRGIDE